MLLKLFACMCVGLVAFFVARETVDRSQLRFPKEIVFGDIPSGTLLTKTFPVYNASEATIVLQQVQLPCGWTLTDLPRQIFPKTSAHLVLHGGRALPGPITGEVVLADAETGRAIHTRITGTVHSIFDTTLPVIELPSITTDVSEIVTIKIRRVDGKKLGGISLKSDVLLSLRIVPLSSTDANIIGVFKVNRLPGNYEGSVELTANDSPKAVFVIPVRFDIKAVYSISPSQALLGANRHRETLRVIGPNANQIEISHVPRGVTLKAFNREGGRLEFQVEKDIRNSDTYLADTILLKSKDARQPAIEIPVYATWQASKEKVELEKTNP